MLYINLAMRAQDILILIGKRMITLNWTEKGGAGKREKEVAGGALDGGRHAGSSGVQRWGRLLDRRCPSHTGEEVTSVQ